MKYDEGNKSYLVVLDTLGGQVLDDDSGETNEIREVDGLHAELVLDLSQLT